MGRTLGIVLNGELEMLPACTVMLGAALKSRTRAWSGVAELGALARWRMDVETRSNYVRGTSVHTPKRWSEMAASTRKSRLLDDC